MSRNRIKLIAKQKLRSAVITKQDDFKLLGDMNYYVIRVSVNREVARHFRLLLSFFML